MKTLAPLTSAALIAAALFAGGVTAAAPSASPAVAAAASPVATPVPAQDTGDLPVVHVADGERLDLEPTVADLAWLAGVWTGSDGGSDWESVYTTGSGGHLVGASKELQQGHVVMTDFEHFYERDGALRMTPYPYGKASVEFTLSDYDGDARRAVFENPDHDFPKRFVYHRTGARTLEIVLEGDMGGEDARFVLAFEKQDG